MKKILFGAIIALTFIFSSCFKQDEYEDSEIVGIYYLNHAIMNQHIVALDPFNVALRLNALLIESEGDYTDQTLITKLFGDKSTVSYDETDGIYSIYFDGSATTDLARTGITIINTNGYANLMEANASWDIKTIASSQYKLTTDDGGIIVNIPEGTSSAYTVSNSGTRWTVRMRNFQSYYYSYSSEKSDWTGTYTIVPDTFSGSSEILKDTKFYIDVDVESSVAMRSRDEVNVSTENPIRFNPVCGVRALAPGGTMKVILASGSMLDPTSYYTATWLTSISGCLPPLLLSYNGITQEFEGLF